jgi:hypothetical protein
MDSEEVNWKANQEAEEREREKRKTYVKVNG